MSLSVRGQDRPKQMPRWSAEAVTRALRLREQGLEWQTIAERVGRSAEACRKLCSRRKQK